MSDSLAHLRHEVLRTLARGATVTVLLALFLVGCGGGTSPTATPPIDLAGVWTLRTVNGTPLPVAVPSTAGRVPGDKLEQYYGSLELSADIGLFGIRDSLRYTSAGGFASTNVQGDDGYVSRNGSVLTLRSGRATTVYTVAVVDASLHTTRDAAEYVYTR